MPVTLTPRPIASVNAPRIEPEEIGDEARYGIGLLGNSRRIVEIESDPGFCHQR